MTSTTDIDLTAPELPGAGLTAMERRWLYENFSRIREIIDALSLAAGAPSSAEYIVKTASAGLSAERVLTDTATVTWDFATAGQAKANAAAGAPANAEFITAAVNGSLSAERVLTDTATVTWDFTTPGQAKATAVGGGGLTQPQVMARGLGA